MCSWPWVKQKFLGWNTIHTSYKRGNENWTFNKVASNPPVRKDTHGGGSGTADEASADGGERTEQAHPAGGKGGGWYEHWWCEGRAVPALLVARVADDRSTDGGERTELAPPCWWQGRQCNCFDTSFASWLKSQTCIHCKTPQFYSLVSIQEKRWHMSTGSFARECLR